MSLPDITKDTQPDIQRTLDYVGMSNIILPITIKDGLQSHATDASCNVGINITDPQVKGIHMSRLHRIILDTCTQQSLSLLVLDQVCSLLIDSHQPHCNEADLSFSFRLKLPQTSLYSNEQGYIYYPIQLAAHKKNAQTTFTLQFTITYSSTCPCSAALSRQAISEHFLQEHAHTDTLDKATVATWLNKEHAIIATPHAQRSKACIKLTYTHAQSPSLSTLIHEAEHIIQTAVQTRVRREDEKAFAIKNGTNLMFCEDAIKRFTQWLDTYTDLADYTIETEHFESLHPHNAIARTSKKK